MSVRLAGRKIGFLALRRSIFHMTKATSKFRSSIDISSLGDHPKMLQTLRKGRVVNVD